MMLCICGYCPAVSIVTTILTSSQTYGAEFTADLRLFVVTSNSSVVLCLQKKTLTHLGETFLFRFVFEFQHGNRRTIDKNPLVATF